MASPSFRDYRYCWLRDGSFIAYAMVMNGRPDSTVRFLRWVDAVILRYRHKVDRLSALLSEGKEPEPQEFLHARFTTEGFEAIGNWPTFQIDGYGAWLWCLGEYLRKTGDTRLIREFHDSIEVTLDYVRLVWRHPCHDCWEENGDRIHPSSLGCIYGGIRSINAFLGQTELEALAHGIRRYILSHLTADGRLPKHIGSDGIDASLMWVSIPFGVLEVDDPVMVKTIGAIEDRLLEKGGVKRYPQDTYFGGGQWILLSCWLGWCYAMSGKMEKARELLSWVEARADTNAHLAEQDLSVTNDPSSIERWERKSGKVARPLLWSHAMYLVLNEVCARAAAQNVSHT